jgi:hypothetical protein
VRHFSISAALVRDRPYRLDFLTKTLAEEPWRSSAAWKSSPCAPRDIRDLIAQVGTSIPCAEVLIASAWCQSVHPLRADTSTASTFFSATLHAWRRSLLFTNYLHENHFLA